MLAVDVGNTHITSALFDGPDIKDIVRFSTASCIQSGRFLDLLAYSPESITGQIIISSVRKAVTDIIVDDCRAGWGVEPFITGPDTDMGITNSYRTIETLGMDRLVNAAAGYHLYGRGVSPLVIIDMGTATTIDYVTREGEFVGGAIAPGLTSAYQGLHSMAPELPLIEMTPVQTLIGQTTDECMRSGVIVSHAAMVVEMACMMAREKQTTPLVVVTGGHAGIVANNLPKAYIMDENLILKGLSIIYKINNC
ncbi:MAG TPA: type III pantothenate kinase [Deltaproteobacteria bacterium]|nr:type III pantothenate kinase [Deltaproteobacteria bacterium]